MVRQTIQAKTVDAPSRSGARERLLDATSELLGERDTLELSLMEISARSGLNHGLVKYYFGGKEGLLLALLERDASKALQGLAALVATEMPPRRKIELHIRGVINTYFRFPYINRLINMLQSSSADNARELSRIFIIPLRDHQATILDEARKAGVIRDVDATFFYFTVIGACDFLFHSRSTLPFISGSSEVTAALKDDYAGHLVKFVIDGVRAPSN